MRSFWSGVISGQIAGLVMAVVVMAVFAIFLGHSPLYPVQVIGSFFYGEGALVGTHWGAIIAGLLIHQLGPSLFWGAAFGVIAGALATNSYVSALVLGIVFGVISMVVDVYFAVPMLMVRMHGVDIWAREVPLFWDWAAHLVFGASFVVYPWILRKLQPTPRA